MFERAVKSLEIRLGRFNNIRIYAKRLLRIACRALSVFPIKKNQVLFKAYSGAQYSCNPKYICEYLLEKRKGQLRIIWAFRSPGQYKRLEERGIKPIRWLSPYYLYALATSKVIVSNVGGDSVLPRRRGQVFIETWHGSGAYKKGDKNTSRQYQKDLKSSLAAINVFLSGCKRFEECLIRETLGLNDVQVLSEGCPRNDIFFCPQKMEEAAAKVRAQFAIPQDCAVALYAPTYRDDLRCSLHGLDFARALAALEARFRRKFVLGLRLHYYFPKTYFEGKELECVDFSAHDDMQEILCAADVLITDYSSCMWDFSLMHRPCFIYAPDLDKYKEERDFFTPAERWPFPIARDNGELARNIAGFSEDEYARRVSEHHRELGSCETGRAAEAAGELICAICSGQKGI